ncbi:MAG TPA: hypothetical protein VK074_05795, partial [Fodinibius sp.]|nr:hypothetical protein [Fodinibius sp.]
TGSVPSTIDKAYPFVKNGTIVLGFPDILFQPADAFSTLLYKQQFTGADLVLGLFRAVNPEKVDMVEFNDKGAIKDIIVKPDHTILTYTWIIAVWTSRFTDYMHRYLAQYNKTLVQNKKSKGGERESAEIHRELDITGELFIGKVFRDAIQSGLQTSYVIFEKGSFLDIGTPDDLMKVNNIDWMKQFNMRISV